MLLCYTTCSSSLTWRAFSFLILSMIDSRAHPSSASRMRYGTSSALYCFYSTCVLCQTASCCCTKRAKKYDVAFYSPLFYLHFVLSCLNSKRLPEACPSVMLTLRIGPDRIVFDFIIMSRIGLSGLPKPQDRMTCRFRSVRRTQCWTGGGEENCATNARNWKLKSNCQVQCALGTHLKPHAL